MINANYVGGQECIGKIAEASICFLQFSDELRYL